MSVSKVRKWVRNFKDGRTNVNDEGCSGRSSVITDNLMQAVETNSNRGLGAAEHKDKRFAISSDFLIRYEEEGRTCRVESLLEMKLGYPISPRNPSIHILPHILSRQGQSQTNSVKVQDYGSSVLGQTRCFTILDFGPQGTTINSFAYFATVRKLQRALQNGAVCCQDVLLLHYNARPRTSRTTQQLIESFGWGFWIMHHTAPTLL
ncbi:HTH_48 domain-containing protein [Trichonephila clavipes]|nr:HTH_48 domain-containing protein [Trichonephila clavipes]